MLEGGVEGALISGNRQRYLQTPPEAIRNSTAEALKKRHVGGVTDRFTAGEESDGQLEPDRRRDFGEVNEGESRQLCVLDPTDLRGGDRQRPSDVCLPQSLREPRLMEPSARVDEHAPCAASRAVDLPPSTRHGAIVGIRSYRRLTGELRAAALSPAPVAPGGRTAAERAVRGDIYQAACTLRKLSV